MMRRAGYLLLGAAAGGFFGSVLAMLLAPSSGLQLRRNLRGRAAAIAAEFKDAAAERRAMLEHEIDQLRYGR